MNYFACVVSSLYHENLLQLVNELAEFVIVYTYVTNYLPLASDLGFVNYVRMDITY